MQENLRYIRCSTYFGMLPNMGVRYVGPVSVIDDMPRFYRVRGHTGVLEHILTRRDTYYVFRRRGSQ